MNSDSADKLIYFITTIIPILIIRKLNKEIIKFKIEKKLRKKKNFVKSMKKKTNMKIYNK